MATVASQFTHPVHGVLEAKWSGFSVSGDKGAALFPANNYDEMTVQVVGPTGGTSSLTIEGANTATDAYTTLTGPTGDNLVFTAAGFKTFAFVPAYIRPRLDTVTAGSNVANFQVVISGRSWAR